MNTTNSSANQTACGKDDFNMYYTSCEILVAILSVLGNALVIHVFRKERRLRRRTNYYIVSLAAADFLVGLLGIPFAIMSSLGLPNQLYICLFTVSLLVVLCTISIFSLVAVSVDRYWAILYPMGYSRNVRTRTALVIITICWVAGFIIGLLPLMGWRPREIDHKFTGCFFLCVVDYNYLVFLYFGTIITPALILAAFYAHIYQVVLKQLRQTVTIKGKGGHETTGTMMRLRTLGDAQKREVKATQNLAIIVLFFMVCWIPLYTINAVIAFCDHCTVNKTFMLFCVILSHLNSAGNPILYAYHLKDFRAALKNFFLHIFECHGGHEVNLGGNNRSLTMSRHHNNRSCINYDCNRSYFCKNKPGINNIVKNPTAVAVATTVDANKIWKISEASSSSDELIYKLESVKIMRPGTPYMLHSTNSKRRSFIDDSISNNDDLIDNVFLDDTLPYTDYSFHESGFESSVSENMIPTQSFYNVSLEQFKNNINFKKDEILSRDFNVNKKYLIRSLSDESALMGAHKIKNISNSCHIVGSNSTGS